MRGFFITGTGTGVGKTYLTRGLAHALHRQGLAVGALKPIETGCSPEPRDAVALARACGQPELSDAAGFYRAELPLAPAAIELEGGKPVPPLDALVRATREAAQSTVEANGVTLVEGAGGLWVPLAADGRLYFADYAVALGLPLIVVARDGLGVLSHTISLALSLENMPLTVAAWVLVRQEETLSQRTNAELIQREVDAPVFVLPFCLDDDEALADSVEASGLLDVAIQRPC